MWNDEKSALCRYADVACLLQDDRLMDAVRGAMSVLNNISNSVHA